MAPEAFFENFKTINDLALIFLKGGELEGSNPKVKSKIIKQLKRWFEVIEGEQHKHKPTFEEIFIRWGGEGLQY